VRGLVAAVLAALALVALIWAVASPAAAHDIPADVKINAFFKPDGKRLELLVRLPLASLIDNRFPDPAKRLPRHRARRRADPRRHQGVAHRQYRRL